MDYHIHVIVAFVISIVVLLGLDLWFVGRNPHKVSVKEAGIWTGVFVLAAIAFSFFIRWDVGTGAQVEFLTAYTIEKMLSVDNLFVFILVFTYFKTPKEYQHKVLFWGVLGAIIMRLIFIVLGMKIINLFHFPVCGYDVNIILIMFGLFLGYVGIKSLFVEEEDEDEDFSKSPGAKLIRYFFPRVTKEYHGDKFFVKLEETQYGDTELVSKGMSMQRKIGTKLVRYATPLLIVVGVVEFTDLLFAVDSIPAIFSVSKDPVILFTSNIFAILGLRSMYFLLAGLLPMFKYLDKGVAFILGFIGIKMVISPVYHIDNLISLGVIGTVLVLSIGISLITYKKE